MISSTFRDLQAHRAALKQILAGQGLHPIAMEDDSARADADVIDASLEKVRAGGAYIGILSNVAYGQVPTCPSRNPRGRSLTELEFEEAQRLDRPILLFMMGEEHPIRRADIEYDEDRRRKLLVFRERARQMRSDSAVHRVFATFDSLEEFREKAARAVAHLDVYLRAQEPLPATVVAPASIAVDEPELFPAPPTFYAEPPYIGSHMFVGRRAELDRLSAWAALDNRDPVLLFEAIGGTGKSMLTWRWTTQHATEVRRDWAGVFWYSFYEKGAVMEDFCRRALAYVTHRPLRDFEKKKTPELAERLLLHLRARPWLMVLDGLERVLVAYDRVDAAQLADEEAGAAGPVAGRDPSDAIRPEDDELLRTLAAAAPSKLLITSRLTPRVLLNRSGQAIPGVVRVPLAGLNPSDAEALLCSCEITGSSEEIQRYLKVHCDCHPLVTGVLAGLISNYLPAPGNFDAWAADRDGGGRLNLADLNLAQKRNHILHTAMAALPDKSRELLSMLALLTEAADYATLSGLNPHLPSVSSSTGEFRHAPEQLAGTVLDLERRGLLQRDASRYDLHPIVRSVAAARVAQSRSETDRYGQRVVDYFSQQTRGLYDQVENLHDLRYGLQVLRTFLRMGRLRQAYGALAGDLHEALLFKVEAYSELLTLLRAFFPVAWKLVPDGLTTPMASDLAREGGRTLGKLGQMEESMAAYDAAVLGCLRMHEWGRLRLALFTLSQTLGDARRFARQSICLRMALQLANRLPAGVDLFKTRLGQFQHLSVVGRWTDAEYMWARLDRMGRGWPRKRYRPGDADLAYAQFRFWRGDLEEKHLNQVADAAGRRGSRLTQRRLHGLRGRWLLEQGRWGPAADSLHEAVRMAREAGNPDSAAVAGLALARLHLGRLTDSRDEAERLARAPDVHHASLAELWMGVGDHEQATRHALAAYAWAWADGEPHVHRYELNRATALLAELGVGVPDLPPYDPAKDRKLPWEDEVKEAIDDLPASVEPSPSESRSAGATSVTVEDAE